MRTGAIFARGSCRALKWMALVGVVFALGAGQAFAQITVTVPDDVNEGADVRLTVGGTISIPADTVAGVLTITGNTPTTGVATTTATPGEAEDFGSIGQVQINTPAHPATATAARTFTIPAGHALLWAVGRDPENAEDEVVNVPAFTVAHTAITGLTAPTGKDGVVIKDTETQGYVLSLPTGTSFITEGAGAATTLTLMAEPPKTVDLAAIAFGMSPNDPSRYTLASDTTTLTAGGSAAATIQALADGNRMDDTLTVTAYGGAPLVALKSIEISVKDINKLPASADITAMAYDEMTGGDMVTSVAEGGEVYIEVMVDRGNDGYPMGEAIEVDLSLSDTSLGTLAADMVTVPAGTGDTKAASRVKLTAAAMDNLQNATLMVNLTASGATAANGSGSVTGQPLTLTITNTNLPNITAKTAQQVDDAVAAAIREGADEDGRWSPAPGDPDDGDQANEMATLEVSDLFTGYGTNSVTLDVASSNPSIVSVSDSGGTIKLTAEMIGTATITVTATIARLGSSATISTQTDPDTAQVMFDVTAVASLTDKPEEPTVVAAGSRAGQHTLHVMFEAPMNNDGLPLTYRVRVKHEDWDTWGNVLEYTGSPAPVNVATPGEYEAQVRAVNSVGPSAWSSPGTGMTGPPVNPGAKGQITEFKLIGDVDEKTIAGTKRYHVMEGSQGVDLSVTVQWTHAEIAAIGYNTAQRINVEIRSGGSTLPNWLSWIDAESDVHFPRSTIGGNLYGGVVTVRTPRLDEVPEAQRGSDRHVKSKTGKLDVLILHDDHEAENDAFYIEAISGDVDLYATAAVNRVTPEVVIEDDEDQKVRIRNSRRSEGPSVAYEPAGDPDITDPVFTIDAVPARVDLPLEVRLDMLDLSGTTVSSGKISLSTASLTLREGGTGSNSGTVTVHLPDSDGDRVDDDYELHASVNLYSVASGGYETIPAAKHAIKVVDRHKLPALTVSPTTGTVKEGDKVELTLTINRNPANTTVSTTEKRQYTDEEVSIMLTMGAGSTAGASDFSVLTNPVTFPKRERGSYTATKTVEVMATADNELDDMEMLVLDAMLSGAVAANGTDKTSHAGVSMLTIEEATAKLVWAKTQEEVEAAVYAAKNAGMGDDMTFNPGEMIELMGSALFNSAEGVTLSYSAMTSDGNVASTSVGSGGMAMVTAKGAGMADITITAHASMPSGVKRVEQTDPREASIMFPVEVGLEALSITLSGPEDMNVVEGGMGAMVTATANRAVTDDTKVMLMRDRAMSSAGDDDYTAEPITIMAGQMSGSTMVMAVEDNMMESVDNMPEELVLYGMTEGMAGEVTGEVKLYLWDAAVPALPIIAQLLLAAFLALGGYRRYRRR